MTEYFSPGVYIQEVESGPQPIEGVSTSVAGAVGVTARGPTIGRPTLVTSFLEYQRTFGSFLPQPTVAEINQFAADPTEGGRWWTFPLAVKGFFDNGGQELYVARVVSTQATPSTIPLVEGVVSHVTLDATFNAATTATIALENLIGIDTSSTLQFYRGDTGGVLTSLVGSVQSYSSAYSQVTITAASISGQLLSSRGDYAVVVPPTATNSLTFTAKSQGDWGNDLSVMVRPVANISLSLASDPNMGDQTATGTLTASVASGVGSFAITALTGTFSATGGRLSINGDEYYFSAFSAGTITLAAPTATTTKTYPANASVRQLRRSGVAAGTTVVVANASSVYKGALIELDNGTVKTEASVQGITGSTISFLPAIAAGVTYYEGDTLRVIEAEVDTEYAPAGGTATTETLSGLRFVNDNTTSYIVTAVNTRSQLVNVVVNNTTSSLAEFPIASVAPYKWSTLSGGADNNDALTPNDFVGVDGGPGLRTGITSLEDIDEIAIIMAPGMWSSTVQNGLISLCETMLDRFAILDSPRPDPNPLGIDDVKSFRGNYDTEYAALYYPWLTVNDPSVSQNVLAPPSGHMAGIYARVDNARGVWKAPANEPISSIVQLDQLINQREQDLLNPYPTNINVLRFFTNGGNRVWGARVISSDSEWTYINVRRLFIYLESSLKLGTQWAVFEPNDETLWARMRSTVTNFLTTTWRAGALQGTTAAEAFFVKCDATTMTQDDIDNGRLIIIVGVAPVKPAEFVIFQIQQYTAPAASS